MNNRRLLNSQIRSAIFAINIVVFQLVLIGFSFLFFSTQAYAQAVTSETVSFQGKIVLNSAGNEGLNVSTASTSCVVAGADTCRFKVSYYTDGTGSTLMGSETFTNVELGNYDGVFNLALGTQTFTAGTVSSFTEIFTSGQDNVHMRVEFAPDGVTLTENFGLMPMRATPFALSAKYIGGMTADDFVRFGPSAAQVNSGTNASIFINNTSTANLLDLQLNGSSAFFVGNNGRVGIGTDSPLYHLDIRGTTSSSANLRLNSHSSATGGSNRTFLRFAVGGVNKSYISYQGDASPQSLIFSVSEAGLTNVGYTWLTNTYNDKYTSRAMYLSDGGQLQLAGALRASGTESSYIIGNLGIGDTNPSYKLHVDGDVGWSGYLRAGLVMQQRLTNLATNHVNNPTVSGNIYGWGNIKEDGSGSSSTISYDSTEKSLKITNSGNYGIRPQVFQHDPNKIYRVKMKVKKSEATGRVYVGAVALSSFTDGDEASSNQQGTSNLVNVLTTRSVGAASTNQYFWSSTLGLSPTDYVDLEVYILGANIDVSEFPGWKIPTGPNQNPAIRVVDSDVPWIGIRVLNWENGVITTSVHIKDVSVTEVGPSVLVNNLGNIGIGTVNPSERLDVTGNVRFSGALMPGGSGGTAGQFLVSAGTGNAPTWTNTVPATSLAWSSLTAPTANLSLAHAGYTTAFTFNSLTTADAFALSSTSLTTGTILDLSSTSTAGGVSGLSKVLDITRSGTNANASHTAYGLYSAVTNTGTTSTNVGGYFSASGATNNYAAIFNAGNVGIGTTSPANKLHVTGNNAVSGSDFIALFQEPGITPESGATIGTAADRSIMVQGNGGAFYLGRDITNDIEFGMGTSVLGEAFAGSVTDHNFSLRTNNTNRLTIDTVGKLGIGITTPQTGLHLRKDPGISITSVTATGGLATDWNVISQYKIDHAETSGNALAFFVSGTANERKSFIQSGHTANAYAGSTGDLYLNPFGGNVGVGVTTTSYKLDVNGDVRAQNGWFRTTGDTGWQSATHGGGWYMLDTTWIRTYGGKSIYQNTGIMRTDGTLQVGSGGATLNVISGGNFSYRTNVIFANTTGNVGIGTATPGSYLLNVNGTGNFAGALTASGGLIVPAGVNNLYGGTMNVVHGNWGSSNHVSGVTNNKWIKVAEFTLNGNYSSFRMAVGNGGRRAGSSGEGNPFSMYVQARNDTVGLPTPVVWLQGLTNHASNVKDVRVVHRSGTGVTNNLVEVWVQFGANWSDSFPVEIQYWGTGTLNFLASAPQPQQDDIDTGGLTVYAINSYARAQDRLAIGPTPYVPSITLGLGDAGTGLNWNSTNNFSLYTGNSERVRIASDGNVGIGSVSPSERLDVTGNVRFSGALMPNNLPGTAGYFLVSAGAGAPPTWTNTVSATSLSWSGLTNPTTNLSLNHGTYTTAFDWATGTGTNNLFSLTTTASSNGTGSLLNLQTGTSSTVSPLRVRASGVESLFVNSSGNVGVGIVNPRGKLHVTGNFVTSNSNGTVRKYSASINDSAHASIIKMGEFTMTGNSRNYTISGRVIGQSSQAVGSTDFEIHVRSNTLPSKSIRWTQRIINNGRIINVKVYEDTTSGRVVIGIEPSASLQNFGWDITITERFDYNDWENADTSTALDTIGLTEISEYTATQYSFPTGNVGIGTTAPDDKLHIKGTSGTYGFKVENPSIAIRYGSLSYDATTDNVIIGGYTGNAAGRGLKFNVNADSPSTKMFIEYTGNVGIATTSPLSRLHMVSEEIGTGTNKGFRIDNYNSTQSYSIRTGVTSSQNTSLSFYDETAGANRIVLLNSGNVGVGTTSPEARLHVDGGASGNDIFRVVRESNVNSSFAFSAPGNDALLVMKELNAGTAWAMGIDTSNADSFTLSQNTAFGTNDYFTIIGQGGTAGNVGIGTTNPLAKLDISGTGTWAHNSKGVINLSGTDNNISFLSSSSGTSKIGYDTTNSIFRIESAYDPIWIKSGPNDANKRDIFFKTGDTDTVAIKTTGNVGIGTTAPAGLLHLAKDSTYNTETTNALKITDAGLTTVGAVFGADTALGAFYIQSLDPGTSYITRPLLLNPNGGNVGIGTTSPSAGLHIQRSSSHDGLSAGALISGAADSDKRLMLGYDTSNDYGFIASVHTNTAWKSLVLQPTAGFIGIGTTTPNQQLEITQNFRLPTTTYNSGNQYGIIYKDGNRFIHDFNYGDNGTVTTLGFNTLIGVNAGNLTMGSTATQTVEASYNTAVGNSSLLNNTKGYRNSSLGYQSLYTNTTGYHNTAIGNQALRLNNTGNYNTALGASALGANTSAGYNTAIGNAALGTNTTGNYNTSVGVNALGTIVGNYHYNTGFGYNAGRHLANGSTANQTSSTSLFLGALTKAYAAGGSNEIVLGYDTTGFGSNTAAYGNNSIIQHIFQAGNVGIGTTNPGEKLEVVGNIISKGTAWTTRTSAADENWYGVAYGNGLYVAVAISGTSNRVMTSPDGINWTTRTSAADIGWTSVAYGNGLFVAVAWSGTGNRVMTSPDGINWTIRTSAADNQWMGVTYGDGLFVAVAISGTGNRVMTSPDGINWTIRTSAADNVWNAVTYGNGLFVAVSDTGTGNRVMTSPDGINWTIRTSAADNGWNSVIYSKGLFVAVADSGTGNRVMTSPDGIIWTIRTSAANNAWNSITYGNGLFVAVASSGTGNRVMTSPDGITWTIRTSAVDNTWNSITYGNGLFVTVGSGGVGNRVMTSGQQDKTVLAHNNLFQGGMNIMGNVGIGITTPQAKLQIDQRFDGGSPSLRLNQPVGTWGTTAWFNSYRYIQTDSSAADGPFRQFNVGAGGVSIGYPTTPIYGSSDALYVSGNVGIGTTAPGTHRLSVVGTAGLSTGTAWTNTSDSRYKNIVEEMTGSSLDKILALRPVTFKWNSLHQERFSSDTDKLNLGFIAQEVEAILPNFVTTDEKGYKWYNPSGFEALLTAGVQEQQLLIVNLEGSLNQSKLLTDDKFSKLSNRVTNLESRVLEINSQITDTNLSIIDLQSTIATLDQGAGLGYWQYAETGISTDYSVSSSALYANEGVFALLETNLLNVAYGLFTVDNLGNVKVSKDITIEGGIIGLNGVVRFIDNIFAPKVTSNQFEVENPAGFETAGSATVIAEETFVTIETQSIKANSKVLVTPRSNTFGEVLYVGAIIEGESFTVQINNAQVDGDILFDWWIIDTTVAPVVEVPAT